MAMCILGYLVYGFYLFSIDVVVNEKNNYKNDFSKKQVGLYYDYVGSWNIRSTYSTGLSTIDEISKEAKLAGLDFIFFTDTNYFEPNENKTVYTDGLLISKEREFFYLDSRFLFFSTTSTYPEDNFSLQYKMADLLSQDSSQNRDEFLGVLQINGQKTKWQGEIPSGVNSLEILNPRSMSDSVWSKSKASILWSLIIFPFNWKYAFLRLFSEPEEELAIWDNEILQKKIYGFAGAEASARAIPYAKYLMRFPSYQKSLSLVANHVILKSELNGHAVNDRKKIMNAIYNGNFYFSIDLLGDATGFQATIEQGDAVSLMGSTIEFKKNTKLKIKIPNPPKEFYEIRIIKNGSTLQVFNTNEVEFDIKESGVYRVAVRVSPLLPFPEGKRWFTWIYSNPFWVYSSKENFKGPSK